MMPVTLTFCLSHGWEERTRRRLARLAAVPAEIAQDDEKNLGGQGAESRDPKVRHDEFRFRGSSKC